MCYLAGRSHSFGGPPMKRIAVIALGILAVSTGAFAQSPDIDTPLLALPANLRADAGVVKWKPDHTYDTLKPSKTGLVCYDRSGLPLQQPIPMECTAGGNVPRAKQNMEAGARGGEVKSEAKL